MLNTVVLTKMLEGSTGKNQFLQTDRMADGERRTDQASPRLNCAHGHNVASESKVLCGPAHKGRDLCLVLCKQPEQRLLPRTKKQCVNFDIYPN